MSLTPRDVVRQVLRQLVEGGTQASFVSLRERVLARAVLLKIIFRYAMGELPPPEDRVDGPDAERVEQMLAIIGEEQRWLLEQVLSDMGTPTDRVPASEGTEVAGLLAAARTALANVWNSGLSLADKRELFLELGGDCATCVEQIERKQLVARLPEGTKFGLSEGAACD